MDSEFHYWVTGVIAYEAGFSEEETEIIAYGSQLVDENDILYKVRNISGRIYENNLSQTMDIFRSPEYLSEIYAYFHFIPDYQEGMSDTGKDIYTRPNSPIAQKFLHTALSLAEDNPQKIYRIAIASHAYVDTWAHQNFCYYYTTFNIDTLADLKREFHLLGTLKHPLRTLFNRIMRTLSIGHGSFKHQPDEIGMVWSDTRPDVDKHIPNDEGVVINNDRFIEAAEYLYRHYRTYLESKDVSPRLSWGELREKIESIWQEESQEVRIKLYRKLLPLSFRGIFDKMRWFNDAIFTEEHGRRDSTNPLVHHFTIMIDKYYWRIGESHSGAREQFDTIPDDALGYKRSHWYLFQESIKDHMRLGDELLGDMFDRVNFSRAKDSIIRSMSWFYDLLHGNNHTANVFFRISIIIMFLWGVVSGTYMIIDLAGLR